MKGLHFAWGRDRGGVRGFSCLRALRRRTEAFESRFQDEGGWGERRGGKEERLSGGGRRDNSIFCLCYSHHDHLYRHTGEGSLVCPRLVLRADLCRLGFCRPHDLVGGDLVTWSDRSGCRVGLAIVICRLGGLALGHGHGPFLYLDCPSRGRDPGHAPGLGLGEGSCRDDLIHPTFGGCRAA